jgi:hypothetical protein
MLSRLEKDCNLKPSDTEDNVELLRDSNPEQEEVGPLEQSAVDKLPSMRCTPSSAMLPAAFVVSTTFPVMVEHPLMAFASSWEARVAEEQEFIASTMPFQHDQRSPGSFSTLFCRGEWYLT